MGVREDNAAGAATARATPSSSTSCARTSSSAVLHGFSENKLSTRTGYTDAAVRRHRLTNARNSFHQISSAAMPFAGPTRCPPCTPGSRAFTDSNLPHPTASWVGGPLAKPWDAGTDSDTCIQIAAAPTDHDGKPVWTGQTDSKGNNNAAFACATALMAAANSEAEGNSLNSPADCQARACARARRSASVLTFARNRDSGSTICWASEASIRARIDRAPPATSRSIRSARSVRYSEAR